MRMVCDDGENNRRIHSKLTIKRALPTNNIVESMVMMLMMMLMMTRVKMKMLMLMMMMLMTMPMMMMMVMVTVRRVCQ